MWREIRITPELTPFIANFEGLIQFITKKMSSVEYLHVIDLRQVYIKKATP